MKKSEQKSLHPAVVAMLVVTPPLVVTTLAVIAAKVLN